MITIHCIDVSGSMSDEQIKNAKQEMLNRFKPKDIVVIFDVHYTVVTDIDRDFRSLLPRGGGTCAHDVITFVKTQNALSILYGDGYMVPDDLAQFNTLVKV